jgi:hypothetical protein
METTSCHCGEKGYNHWRSSPKSSSSSISLLIRVSALIFLDSILKYTLLKLSQFRTRNAQVVYFSRINFMASLHIRGIKQPGNIFLTSLSGHHKTPRSSRMGEVLNGSLACLHHNMFGSRRSRSFRVASRTGYL